jgi:hypothetical protein
MREIPLRRFTSQTLSVLKTISGNTDDEVRRGSATLLSGHIGGSADGPANPYPKTEMRSEFVLIASVGCKNLAQMGFAEDDDVIEAFPADRADQSLRMPILQGRLRGGRVIAYKVLGMDNDKGGELAASMSHCSPAC